MEQWRPGACSSDPWTQPLRVTETIETLAAATAESYANDPEALEKLFSTLQDYAACDGPINDEEQYALQWISYMFDRRSTKPRNVESTPTLRLRPRQSEGSPKRSNDSVEGYMERTLGNAGETIDRSLESFFRKIKTWL